MIVPKTDQWPMSVYRWPIKWARGLYRLQLRTFQVPLVLKLFLRPFITLRKFILQVNPVAKLLSLLKLMIQSFLVNRNGHNLAENNNSKDRFPNVVAHN